MKAFIEGNVVDYTSVNDLAKSVIFDKMYQEGATSMADYLEGWADTMNEIEADNGEDFTPYTSSSVMDVAVSSIENEVGVVEGNTAFLGKSPIGFYEAVTEVINQMMVAGA
jgi:hypothetical protein